MENLEILNLKLAKIFAKNLIPIIALFAIFACGFAAIILQHYGEDSFETTLSCDEDDVESTLPSANDFIKSDVLNLLWLLALLPLIGPILILLICSFGLMLLPSNFEEKEDLSKKIIDVVSKATTLSIGNAKKGMIQDISKRILYNISKEISEQSLKTDSENK